eukprot:gb/GFBE01042914.1/.p1 GENE.gb/GFBE01042914.1/~~gb/GFBE01042914.1/.p1  ORF type:complete len:889 (+),score=152.05 gb/GFBE01042914.1/:1-2667(+)
MKRFAMTLWLLVLAILTTPPAAAHRPQLHVEHFGALEHVNDTESIGNGKGLLTELKDHLPEKKAMIKTFALEVLRQSGVRKHALKLATMRLVRRLMRQPQIVAALVNTAIAPNAFKVAANLLQDCKVCGQTGLTAILGSPGIIRKASNSRLVQFVLKNSAGLVPEVPILPSMRFSPGAIARVTVSSAFQSGNKVLLAGATSTFLSEVCGSHIARRSATSWGAGKVLQARKILQLHHFIAKASEHLNLILKATGAAKRISLPLLDAGSLTGGLTQVASQLAPALPTVLPVAATAALGAVVLQRAGLFRLFQTRETKTMFCAKSTWTDDPWLYTDRPEVATVGQARGMPQCEGLKKVQLYEVTCGHNINCLRAACQQACCDDARCHYYQFTTQSPKQCWLSYASTCKRDLNAEWTGKRKSETGDSWLPDAQLESQVLGLKRSSARAEEFCQDECSNSPSCLFYQWSAGRRSCWLSPGLDLASYNSAWYGGFLADSGRGCASGQRSCPATMECVDSCAFCEGFTDTSAQDGPCRSRPEEMVCDAGSWDEVFEESRLSTVQCQNLEKTDVDFPESVSSDGHDVCREACCADPDCVLYQFESKNGARGLFRRGDKMVCYLGRRTASAASTFGCRKASAGKWEGGYLLQRGCGTGLEDLTLFACLTSNTCVEDCARDCPGAPLRNEAKGRCDIPREEAELEEIESNSLEAHPIDDVEESDVLESHKLEDFDWDEEDDDVDEDAIEPQTTNVDPEPRSSQSYYLLNEEASQSISEQQQLAADLFLSIDQNKQSIVTPRTHEAACKLLTFPFVRGCARKDADSCQCTFEGPAECEDWFGGDYHLRPVINSDIGMALLVGSGCSCQTSEQTCTFKMLSELPMLRLTEMDEFALELGA